MNQCIKWFRELPEKYQQWLWFIGLWCCGLATVMLMGFIIRKAMGL